MCCSLRVVHYCNPYHFLNVRTIDCCHVERKPALVYLTSWENIYEDMKIVPLLYVTPVHRYLLHQLRSSMASTTCNSGECSHGGRSLWDNNSIDPHRKWFQEVRHCLFMHPSLYHNHLYASLSQTHDSLRVIHVWGPTGLRPASSWWYDFFSRHSN
jgi:hypothetical protein